MYNDVKKLTRNIMKFICLIIIQVNITEDRNVVSTLKIKQFDQIFCVSEVLRKNTVFDINIVN